MTDTVCMSKHGATIEYASNEKLFINVLRVVIADILFYNNSDILLTRQTS